MHLKRLSLQYLSDFVSWMSPLSWTLACPVIAVLNPSSSVIHYVSYIWWLCMGVQPRRICSIVLWSDRASGPMASTQRPTRMHSAMTLGLPSSWVSRRCASTSRWSQTTGITVLTGVLLNLPYQFSMHAWHLPRVLQLAFDKIGKYSCPLKSHAAVLPELQRAESYSAATASKEYLGNVSAISM